VSRSRADTGPMTVEQELRAGPNSRPLLAARGHRDLCSGKPISDDNVEAIATSLIEGNAPEVLGGAHSADMPAVRALVILSNLVW